MNVPPFKEINNRDAWSTIRGFVYQVDQTILHWVRLKENEALELERGEDIDLIGNEIGQAEIRTLEQLKHREAKISLNQELTLEVLYNFYLHIRNNPELKLKFRFVTNSEYTLERPAIFVDARKGIEVWTALQKQPLINSTDNDLLSIKKHLLKKIAENANVDSSDSVEKQTIATRWAEFGKYLEVDSQLVSFVQDFEWSTQNSNPNSISTDIIQELEQRYKGQPVQLLYERLFLYVFKILCRPSIKRLDLAILNAQAVLPALAETDKSLFSILQNLLNDLQDRLKKVESDNSYAITQIHGLYQSVNALKSHAAFDLHLNNISFTPPNLIEKGTLRTEKVNEVKILFSQTDWVSFHGLNGTGKTQLAALVCQEFEHCYWLDLREMANDAFRAPLVIEAFFTGITHEPPFRDRKTWFKNILSKFAPNTIIVINDIPEVSNNDIALLNLLNSLATTLYNSGVKILTTSNYKLPPNLKSVGTLPIIDFEDLNFSRKEIQECLINNGAGSEILKYITLIEARSHRNPRLVLAIIYHLKELNWGQENNSLDNLVFDNEFSAEILIDAQRSISKYIGNEQTRELLYRLSLISWDFGLSEVKAISEVESKVGHVNEHLIALNNIWIQQLSNKFYQVSPVINNIGESNLTNTVIKNVHAAYASALVQNNKIDQRNAIRAILSYVKAEKFDDAGLLLFNFYRAANSIKEVELMERWGYLNYWYDTPFPDAMNITLKVFIKTEQLRFAKMLKRDTEPFFLIIHQFLSKAEFPEDEALIVKTMLLAQYPELYISHYWEYLRFVIEKWPSFSQNNDIGIELSILSGLLWIPLTSIITKADIETWVDLMNLYENNLGKKVFQHEIALAAVGVICSRISTVDSDMINADNKVRSQLDRLSLLRKYFQQAGQEELKTLVVREEIHINFTQSEDLNELRTDVEAAMQEVKLSGSLYLFTAYLGRMLMRNGHREEAKDWLILALNYDGKEQSDYIETLINMANLIAEYDTKKSIELCKTAVDNASNRSTSTPMIYLQALAELGVAYWIDNDSKSAFATFELLIDDLLVKKDHEPTAEWMRLFSLTGHANGYMASMTNKGEPPVLNGEDYFMPYIGMFTMDQRDFRDLYKPTNDSLVAAQMAFFADGLNYSEKAYEWSLKAFDIARRSKDQASVLMISSTCSQYAVVQFKPEEAFESYLLFAAVSSHLEGDIRTKYDSLSSIDLEKLLEVRPSERWAIAEKTAFEMAILPLLIKVITAYLEDASYKDEWRRQYLYTISDYIPDASDKLLWDLVLEISIKIIDRKTTIEELKNRANTFGDQDKKHLQLLCMLGISFLEEDPIKLSGILLNFIPYLHKVYGKTSSVNKYVILPYIKLCSIRIVKAEFVGTKFELDIVIETIKQIDVSDPNAIQKSLQIGVNLQNIKTLEDRHRWLYSFDEI